MKILAKRDFATPLRFLAGKFGIRWCQGHTEIIRRKGRPIRFKFKGFVNCEQKVTLEKPHVVDHARIVQLDSEEAAQLGLKTALGIVEGRKLA